MGYVQITITNKLLVANEAARKTIKMKIMMMIWRKYKGRKAHIIFRSLNRRIWIRCMYLSMDMGVYLYVICVQLKIICASKWVEAQQKSANRKNGQREREWERERGERREECGENVHITPCHPSSTDRPNSTFHIRAQIYWLDEKFSVFGIYLLPSYGVYLSMLYV